MKPIAFLLALTSPVFAATQFILPGNSESGTWDLINTNYNAGTNPAYPVSGATSTPWGGAIAASSTSATFTRVSGGAYFIGSGSGLYGSQATAAYVVADAEPMPDLANLIFQARMNLAPTSVTLTLNGGATAIPADFFSTTPAGSGSFGSISDFAWQWDLSEFVDPITSYEIAVAMPANSLVYGNEPSLTMVTAGDTYAQVIPEPSVSVLGLVAAAFTLVRRRRA